jgi:hypothetical protein
MSPRVSVGGRASGPTRIMLDPSRPRGFEMSSSRSAGPPVLGGAGPIACPTTILPGRGLDPTDPRASLRGERALGSEMSQPSAHPRPRRRRESSPGAAVRFDRRSRAARRAEHDPPPQCHPITARRRPANQQLQRDLGHSNLAQDALCGHIRQPTPEGAAGTGAFESGAKPTLALSGRGRHVRGSRARVT